MAKEIMAKKILEVTDKNDRNGLDWARYWVSLADVLQMYTMC